MAIERKHKATGGSITQPGEYVVTITDVKSTMSKKEKPMCVVVFEAQDEKKINGYYVKDIKFHMAALKDLKLACGMKETDSAMDLVGKKCGIAVGEGKVREDGSHFMSIEGYGTVAQVETAKADASFITDGAIEGVPF